MTEFELVPLYKRVKLVIFLSFNLLMYNILLACHSIACAVIMRYVIVLLLWFDRVMFCGMRKKWKSISVSSKRLTPFQLFLYLSYSN